MSTTAELSIFPLDKGQSVGAYVARVLDLIDRSGLPYQLGPMGTCIEGEFADVMDLVRRCHEALAADCERVYCVVKLDTRRGRQGMLAGKVRSVEEQLGRKLRT